MESGSGSGKGNSNTTAAAAGGVERCDYAGAVGDGITGGVWDAGGDGVRFQRSALGCPYFLFIMTWYVVALVPAGAQVLTLRLRESSKKRRSVATKELPRIQQSLLLEEAASSADSVPEVKLDMNVSRYLEEEQGTEVEWWVQFIWAVYYAAGTLVFASIMAVTVIELFVWVVLACFTTAMSKMLAFRLCGHWE